MQTRVQVLSEDEIAEVHARTLKVLGTVGMRVDTAKGRAILKQAGADVDEATEWSGSPPTSSPSCLASAPKQFTLGGRRPGFAASLNNGELSLIADGGATSVIDRVSGERREPVPADWWESTKLIDTIDDIGVYWWMVEGGIGNQNPADWVQYWTNLWGTFGKHVQDSFDDPALGALLHEALQIIFGSPEEVRSHQTVLVPDHTGLTADDGELHGRLAEPARHGHPRRDHAHAADGRLRPRQHGRRHPHRQYG